jgi:hypothetical protein
MGREERARKGARDAEMEKLRQAAFMAEVQYERKMEAKRRKKQAEEAARKKKASQSIPFALLLFLLTPLLILQVVLVVC